MKILSFILAFVIYSVISIAAPTQTPQMGYETGAPLPLQFKIGSSWTPIPLLATDNTWTGLQSFSQTPNFSYTPAWSGATSQTITQLMNNTVFNGQFAGLVDDPTCSVDQTARLQNAINGAAGKKLKLPSGTFCLNTAASTLTVSAPYTEIQGEGASTIIKWNAPAGTPIAPILDILAAANHTTLHDISFDHSANLSGGSKYVDSTYFGSNVWGGVAVAIESDDFNGYNLWGQNGFDNCFGISQINRSTMLAQAGKPQRFNINNVITRNCGTGVHVAGGPGKIGSGVDNGSGSAGTLSNLVDYSSYGSFISDIGAGASAVWTNVTSFYSLKDSVNTPALYVGSPNNSFSNVTIISPAGNGIWSDYYATGTNYSNINVKNPASNCLFIKGPSVWNNVYCSDVGYSPGGTPPYTGNAGIYVDNTFNVIDGIYINNFTVSTVLSTPAYTIQAPGTYNVIGKINVTKFVGRNAAIDFNAAVTSLQYESQDSNGHGYNNPNASYSWDFGSKMRVQSDANDEAFTVQSLNKSSYLFIKPEIATNTSQIGTWTGSQVGTTNIIGKYTYDVLVASGSPPTTSGCSVKNQAGGKPVGTFAANGICSTGQTIVLNIGSTYPANYGWACTVYNLDTGSYTDLETTAYTTTSVTLIAKNNIGDGERFIFNCTGF